MTPRRRDLFDPLHEIFSVPVRFNSLLQKEYERQLAQQYHHPTSTRTHHYEVREDDSKMELMLDLPGMHASDIKIQLEDSGKLVKISGSRSRKYHNLETSSEFQQMFTIDPKTVDVTNLKANLADGVLIISVPKIQESKIEGEPRIIPIETTTVEDKLDDDVPIVREEKKEDVTAEQHESDDLEITEEDI